MSVCWLCTKGVCGCIQLVCVYQLKRCVSCYVPVCRACELRVCVWTVSRALGVLLAKNSIYLCWLEFGWVLSCVRVCDCGVCVYSVGMYCARELGVSGFMEVVFIYVD